MKELIGKIRNTESSLPKWLVNEKKEITEKVLNSSNSFTSFLNQTHSIIVKISSSINKLKEAFSSLKTNKSPRYDDRNFSVVKKCLGEINEPLKHIINPENS